MEGTAVREYYITEAVGWYSERAKWKKLRSFGAEYKKLKKADGTAEGEKRYYICSTGADASEFERAARGHWGVEVKLHWHLDFTFRDDKNTSMGETGAKNQQIMKTGLKRCCSCLTLKGLIDLVFHEGVEYNKGMENELQNCIEGGKSGNE